MISRINEVEGMIRVRTFVKLDLNGSIIENMWGKIQAEVVKYV